MMTSRKCRKVKIVLAFLDCSFSLSSGSYQEKRTNKENKNQNNFICRRRRHQYIFFLVKIAPSHFIAAILSHPGYILIISRASKNFHEEIH